MSGSRKEAIVLSYPAGEKAPFITANAKGVLADLIIELAEQNGIPVVKNEVLADVLSLSEIGSYIPEETWQLVASIFSAVLQSQNS